MKENLLRTEDLRTPVYLVDEAKLEHNLEILESVQEETGCRILLAQKAFSMYRVYPMVRHYLAGATASGLYEARLAAEEMGGENHVFSPAYTAEEMEKLCRICSHISFNSIAQLERHRPLWETKGISAGLRINPEYSTQEGPAIYDPCAPGSRLGIRRDQFPERLPAGVEGLHVHTLCEQDAAPLVETFEAVEEKFGEYLHQIRWLNLGGGHHITRPGYDIAVLKDLLCRIRDTYHVQVYLEPGEAVALSAGYLITEVMDIVENVPPVLILDASAACHMPDVLEMPYRPPLRDSGKPGEKAVTCTLGCRTCLAGDVIGDYSFDEMPRIGERLVFEDMAIYTMVKNNTFNGMPLPDIALLRKDGMCEVVKRFGYQDFKERLS
ncbi:carboxynorspermidine decarboxylase [Muricomes sp. OA1]|uniref:Carboxynorspermidine decarboxylase n=1 Tax=Hungatella hathewayi TaxID=154046 RepID=A0A3E2WMD1_9FIRM|nr:MULTISPECIES: carboxynorspermidine decarboxylase [Clostridia]MCH1973674.1 carboxynorspermidine decarboxylase [Muricomes sp. OA1]MRM90571.1 carboxynorspermidine decarboxylase [Faecalicatena contorta]RGC28233.1 carboxynorspermidine decarboxylase [Hungatella hathewayi]GKH32440.1 carboxynorspermidine decarboxylase [Faecalicatena contorta]